MATETLGAALEREHREIDERIDVFNAGVGDEASRLASLTRAMDALRRHIYLEEEFLFPPLKAAGMMGPIFVMLREHGDMWRTMDVFKAELADHSTGNSPQDLCKELITQLDAHNTKEEVILYSQADAVLSAAANAELTEFLASGQTPDGWVCDSARR